MQMVNWIDRSVNDAGASSSAGGCGTEMSGLDDPILSETARWSLETEPNPDQLGELK